MKKFLVLLAALLAASLAWYGCTEGKASETSSKKGLAPLPSLREDELFNEDLVYDFLFDQHERNTDSVEARSKEVQLKAVDLLQNKKQVEESIPLFISSLKIFPSAKTYKLLGDAYFQKHQFQKAQAAYNLAIRLQYQPLGETYFNMACMETETEYGDVGGLLQLAFRNGFSDSTRFVSEPYLKNFRGSRTYSALFMKHFSADQARRNPHFQAFLFSFPTLSLPYSMPESEVGAADYKNDLAYEYSDFIEEMENVSFGRDVSNVFIAEGILAETPSYIVLLYKSVEMYAVYPPVYTMMASYHASTGELIDKKVFACNCSAESVQVGRFDGSTITVEQKERVWESPITEVSIEKNKIKEYRTKSTTHYTIEANGRFKNLTEVAQ
ncbi:MAG: tetratricopeptide repeat protein [Cytophagaceae bacterium]|jgi:tetratricopeptide (TPR) repeat protein|nr:tetratricopeptide repeat protein [Cytophagaceae bacterium]